ncbi:hypothetical protein CEXT_773701 [Caerostris extrusa]|uniref:Ribosomal protein S10 n=1 Tax=Caerostris extrusa TaxID=172846 RepID=A0AAV4UQB6_CAEEX|nr:hypothetical protein CEXT_773701 [Caerostris extrusa]
MVKKRPTKDFSNAKRIHTPTPGIYMGKLHTQNLMDTEKKPKQIFKIFNYKIRRLTIRKENHLKRTEVVILLSSKRTQFGTDLKLLPKYQRPYEVINCKPHDCNDARKFVDQTSADLMKSWPSNNAR